VDGKLPERSDVPNNYKWNLNDIYENIDAWDADSDRVRTLAEKIPSFAGTLSSSITNLKACLDLSNEISMISEKIYQYARLGRDLDNSDSLYQSLSDKAALLVTEISTAAAFIEPEILSIDEVLLKQYIADSGMDDYRHSMEDLLRQKTHTLSKEEERIMAMTTEFSGTADDTFTMLNNADIKFPFIKDEQRNEVELTKGRYSLFLESKNRDVRKSAFEALYFSYEALKNTIATTLSGNIKANSFYSKTREYNSIIEGFLDSDNVPLSVYNNLISVITDNLPTLHKCLGIRKKMLGVSELHPYDLYTPYIDVPDKKYEYEEAVAMVKAAMTPLGDAYVSDLNTAFDSDWIDVYETRGKTSGAFSWGSYMVHPFVLLNYQGAINDVFTIAHEMGHAMHSFYTKRSQSYVNSHYKIFVAEVASTVNELLLMKYLIKNTTDKNEKAYLLARSADDFRTTVFRQVMFAEFEQITHAEYEAGNPLTCDKFCELYFDLNKKYFGDAVVCDVQLSLEWARIPHFYSSFYVYKYATGFSAAVAISEAIFSGKPGAVENYLRFLSSGGSDYPIEILKITGVDLSERAPIESAMTSFSNIISQLEELI
jgi:oligoendopeptidase F